MGECGVVLEICDSNRVSGKKKRIIRIVPKLKKTMKGSNVLESFKNN